MTRTWQMVGWLAAAAAVAILAAPLLKRRGSAAAGGSSEPWRIDGRVESAVDAALARAETATEPGESPDAGASTPSLH